MNNDNLEKEVMVQRGGNQIYVHAVRITKEHPLFETLKQYRWNPSKYKGKSVIIVTRANYNWLSAGRTIAENENLIHINGNLLDDRLENLAPLTASERRQYAYFNKQYNDVQLPLSLLKAYISILKLKSHTKGERMTKKENQEFLEEAIKQAKSGKVENKPYTDEELWNDIKLKARTFLQEDDLCVTEEERDVLKSRIENFSRFGPAMIKACAERYRNDFLMEDIKVRKAHELNEAAKLYVTNPAASNMIMMGMAQMLGANIPQVPNELYPSYVTTENTKEEKDVETGVSLRKDV